MIGWKKICCPIDFSPLSRIAMEVAAEFGWRFGGTITLLHVEEAAPEPSADAALAPRDTAWVRALERDRQLDSWRDAAAAMSTTPVYRVLATGDPAAEIVRHAEAGDFDVIVMGTHGRAEERARPVGSVAQKVILDAPCPVLVVNARRWTGKLARGRAAIVESAG